MRNRNIKIAIVSDIHFGPDVLTKKGSLAGELLKEFCSFANNWPADVAVDLGDRISDIDHDSDYSHQQIVSSIFQKLLMPRFHLLGNHDIENLTEADNQAILQQTIKSQIVEMNGFQLVIWQANTSNFWPAGLNLRQNDLAWLAQTLQRASEPCIIFTHVPLDSASMTGNYYFHHNTHHATYPEAAAAREIIEKSGKVILCIAGHVHWNHLCHVNGIPYLALHSLTEASTTFPQPSRTWAAIEISDTLNISISGLDARQISLPTGKATQKWLPPLEKNFTSRLESDDVPSLSQFKTFLFDLDGVFYQEDHPLPGGKELIQYLKETKRDYLAITNNGQLQASEFAQRLQHMGVDFPTEKILTSSEILAEYLFKHTSHPRVYILGSNSFKEYLFHKGVQDSDRPDFVIVAWDREVTISELEVGVAHLLDGAELLATNGDALIPTVDGPRPENGALVAFLERASGKQATVVGKSTPVMFRQALHRLEADIATTLVVGDTLDTDILGANYTGLHSVYINDISCKKDSSASPSYTFANLTKLLEQLIEG